MKVREFIYTGEPVPQITKAKYPAFYRHFQKTILASLKQKGLLTPLQYEFCLEEIEKQYKIHIKM